MCNNYWAKIACNEPMSEPNSEPQAEGPCFWITKRKLRPALIRQYPDCVTLETWDLDLVIVPGISLRCLSQLYFKETIESILKANNEMDSLYLYIRQLWTAIIRVVYHFESTAHQDSKLKEVRSFYHRVTQYIPLAEQYPQMDTPNVEVDNLLKGYRLAHLNLPSYSVRDLSSDHRHQVGNKSKAITGMVNTENREKGDLEEASVPGQVEKGMGDTKDGEDGKDEVDDDEEDLSRKRQKRTDVQRGKCKDFETELNSAGAAMPDFPIALEFADTTLSFRFKS